MAQMVMADCRAQNDGVAKWGGRKRQVIPPRSGSALPQRGDYTQVETLVQEYDLLYV